MCLDWERLVCIEYPKHEAPPQYRHSPLSDIDRLTLGRDSLFYPGVQSRHIEEEVLRGGIYVRSAKPSTIQKVKVFARTIGASEGIPSSWVLVEVTNQAYHGRPITESLFQKKTRQQVACCDGG